MSYKYLQKVPLTHYSVTHWLAIHLVCHRAAKYATTFDKRHCGPLAINFVPNCMSSQFYFTGEGERRLEGGVLSKLPSWTSHYVSLVARGMQRKWFISASQNENQTPNENENENGKWKMNSFRQFSSDFFLLAKQQTKAAMSLMAWEGEERLYYEGSFQSFWLAVANKKKWIQLNWFWMRHCLPPVYCPIEKCVGMGKGKRGGGGAKQGDYNSIKLPSGPALHWLTFALTFALSVIARAAALCLFGDLCCPARGLPTPHTHSTEDWELSAAVAVFVMPQ